MFRRITTEFKAHLEGEVDSPFSGTSAKVECKLYSNGQDKIKVKIRGLELGDSSTVSLWIDGTEYAAVHVYQGRGELKQLNPKPGKLRDIKQGSRIDLRIRDRVIMSGEFYDD